MPSEINSSHNVQNSISKSSNFCDYKTIDKIKNLNKIRVLTIRDKVIIEKNKEFLGKLIYANFGSASTSTNKK